MKKRMNLLVVIGMYLLVYNPPLLGGSIVRVLGPFRNMIWMVAPVSVLYVLLNRKWVKENLDWKAILRTVKVDLAVRPAELRAAAARTLNTAVL